MELSFFLVSKTNGIWKLTNLIDLDSSQKLNMNRKLNIIR